MNVPLRWLIGRRELGLRVRACADHLDRAISWAHAIDLPDPVPWLAGGELVLTTGLGLPAEPAGQREYVRGLVRAGSAALGFGIGLSHQDIPDAVVQAAQRLRLPLIEVPLSTPFREVVKTLADEVDGQRNDALVRGSQAQSSMTRAALRQGVAAVVRELATALGARVSLRGSDGTVVAASSAEADALPFPVPESAPGLTTNLTSTDENGITITQPVRVAGRLTGWLVLARKDSLTPADHTLVSQAVSLIVLDRVKPRRLRTAQNRLNTTIFGLGLGRSVPARQFAEHLRDAGFAGAEPRVVAWAGADHRVLLDDVDELLEAENLPTVAVERDEHLVVLLPGPGVEAAKTLISAVVRRSRSVHAGVSEPATPDQLPRALHQALTAARAAQVRRAPLAEFSQLAGHALVFDSRTRDALSELAHERLGRLTAFDHRNGTALTRSLHAYLEHSGQWNSASTALGVHRHTLRGRMEQVRDLLGIDIDSAHVRAELLLSLAAWSGAHATDMAEPGPAELRRDVQ